MTATPAAGGKDHYAADRQAIRPGTEGRAGGLRRAQANRAFLQCVVRFLVGEAGVRQIIDVGTGIPAAGNVHEVAAEVAPGARVAYVDSDRYKSGCAHARRALLRSGSASSVLRHVKPRQHSGLPSAGGHRPAREHRLFIMN